jgi:uncharacterized membrane protein
VSRVAITATFPRPLQALALAYLAASLAHFAHNATYIAFYPGLPAWITRETVWLAWLAVTAIGAGAWLFARHSLHVVALALLAVYGAFGLDGLLHYTLALCAEHTLATNLTIWSEAAIGLLLALVAAVLCARRLATR